MFKHHALLRMLHSLHKTFRHHLALALTTQWNRFCLIVAIAPISQEECFLCGLAAV